MPVHYSELLPPDVHERLMESVDARVSRQQDKRAQLPVEIGRTILGRTRPETHIDTFNVLTIPNELIRSLGRRLQRHPILRDELTSSRNEPPADEYLYQRYVSGGNRRNRRPVRNETDAAAKKQAMLRQTQNVADELHHFTWFQLQLARTSRAALRRSRHHRAAGTPIEDTDGLYAAAAVEDFGHCLTGHPALNGLLMGWRLPLELRRIGVRASSDPNTLRVQNDDFFRLMIHEQSKRVDYWGHLLDAYEDFGGIRRTDQDLLDEAWVDQYCQDGFELLG